MEAATCLAEEISFSSLAWPWTEALAASQRLLVAAATIRACEKKEKKERTFYKSLLLQLSSGSSL